MATRFRHLFNRAYLIFIFADEVDNRECFKMLEDYYKQLVKGSSTDDNPVLFKVATTYEMISQTVKEFMAQTASCAKTATILFVERHSEHPVLNIRDAQLTLGQALADLYENFASWRGQMKTSHRVLYLPACLTLAFVEKKRVRYTTDQTMNRIFTEKR